MVGFDPDAKELPGWSYGVAGAFSGFFTRAVAQPLDVLKIRLQLQEQPIKRATYSKYHGILHAIQTIWKEEGVSAFWKGHNPAQVLSVVYGLVQFSSFEFLTGQVWHWLPTYLTMSVRPATHFVCGSLAGCCATVASHPFDVIRTRFIAQGEPKAYRTILEAGRVIVLKESFRGLYRGILPTLIQIAPQTGFQFTFYAVFSSLWKVVTKATNQNQRDGIAATGGWVCGSASGVCAKIVVYPLDVIKKRLEVQGFGYGNVVVGTARQYRGFLHCLRQVVTYEGYGSLYKGLSPSILKAFVASGLHFAAYEHCIWLFRRTIPVSR